MTEHTHTWVFSYSIKSKGVTEYIYYCKPCGMFKNDKAPNEKPRLSNMGGTFSTNWRG